MVTMPFARFLIVIAALTGVVRSAEVSFNRDIRPILSDNCFSCHGPDKNHREADLRLDVREEAVKQKAIVPGKPEQSALMERILTADVDDLMPPLDSHKKLTSAQKDTLRRWIAEGAEYQLHWAYVPPVVSAGSKSIDDFIRERLAAAGLKPSPPAGKETLIRRVTLDLTGLPPTPVEVDAFLQDTSADAYAKVVDRLLKSPHYGERMAVDWLDAARYADSNGYQVDRDRELWPWRDWVVRAFNSNLPFDQFTIEQLAGDLLPDATLDQRIATGFHRNHMFNEEGGVIAEEFLAEYTADRVETTAAVWLGQTFNCCRCHDHKFDPFTQRDFYALKAFFHNVPERGVGIYSNPVRTNAPPFVKLPAPVTEAKIAALNAKLKPVEDRLSALSAGEVETWAGRVASTQVDWQPLQPVSAAGGDNPPTLEGGAVLIGPQESRANNIKITAKLPKGKFTVLRLECATTAPAASFQWSEFKFGKEKLRALDSAQVMVLDNDRKTLVPLSVVPGKPVQALFEFETPSSGSEAVMVISVENAGGPSQWRFFVATTEVEFVVPEAIAAITKTEAAKRTARERKLVLEYRLAQLPEHRRLTDEAASLKKEIATAEGEIPTTLVMEEQKEPRDTFILMRGAYDKPGEKVVAATPAVLPPLENGWPTNRLGLAKWLVSPQNPITSRVVVNRYWQQLFGTGLVRSSEDFGSQGNPPSHPELLDWLAVTFRQSGWDVKQFMRRLVMSDTYRQSSQFTELSARLDPDNRLLSRGPRFRLPAETIRDQALAASGLLVTTMGGPAVKPYHPPGLYEQVVAQRDNPSATYVQDHGDAIHRRSLYTYWKRSVPHPAMLLFDAPFRETCTLRRSRSNTPLQALNLMNDPTYVEASRFLAQRMMKEGGDARESQIAHGFRLLLARQPGEPELAVLKAALLRAEQDFANDPEAAKQLLTVGEAPVDASLNAVTLAAFTSLASTLLNLDEVITKE